MRFRWLLAALVLASVVAILQQWAVADYLYWKYEWFDVIMHYLGGVAIGVLLAALLPGFRPRAFVLLFAAVVVGWEIFEYVFGIPRKTNYAFDTALDLLIDTLGALTAYVLARFTLWRSA